MNFKTARVAQEWNDPRLDPLLKRIVTEAAGRAIERWNWSMTLTCIFRTSEENDALYSGDGKHLTGVHVVGRGVDVRTQDADPSAVLDITTFTNDRWTYDPERDGMRVALPEGSGIGSSGPHLHFQCSSATLQRETA